MDARTGVRHFAAAYRSTEHASEAFDLFRLLALDADYSDLNGPFSLINVGRVIPLSRLPALGPRRDRPPRPSAGEPFNTLRPCDTRRVRPGLPGARHHGEGSGFATWPFTTPGNRPALREQHRHRGTPRQSVSVGLRAAGAPTPGGNPGDTRCRRAPHPLGSRHSFPRTCYFRRGHEPLVAARGVTIELVRQLLKHALRSQQFRGRLQLRN
jgi:hypothetical protein